MPSWSYDLTEQGLRKYLGEKPEYRVIPKRLKHLEVFCTELEKRLQNPPEDQPLAQPLMEVGYSKDSEKRLIDHSNHTSSKWLTNLTHSILHPLYPDKFFLNQFVVFFILQSRIAALAETLITHFAHGYTFDGRGFSTYRPGRSVINAYNFTPDDWEDFLKHTLDHSAPERNYDAYSARRHAEAEQVRRLEETHCRIALMERYWAVQARLRKIEEKEEVVAAADAARAKIILDRGKVLRAAAKRIIRTVGTEPLIEDAELLLEGYRALEEGRWEEYAKRTEA